MLIITPGLGLFLPELKDTCVGVGEAAPSCLTLCDPMDCQAPSSIGFSRQEYWSGLPFPSPGDLADPGIEPGSFSLQAASEPPENIDKITQN